MLGSAPYSCDQQRIFLGSQLSFLDKLTCCKQGHRLGRKCVKAPALPICSVAFCYTSGVWSRFRQCACQTESAVGSHCMAVPEESVIDQSDYVYLACRALTGVVRHGRLVAPSTAAADDGDSTGEQQEHAGAHPAAGMFLVATVHFSGTMKLQVCKRVCILLPRQSRVSRGSLPTVITMQVTMSTRAYRHGRLGCLSFVA